MWYALTFICGMVIGALALFGILLLLMCLDDRRMGSPWKDER